MYNGYITMRFVPGTSIENAIKEAKALSSLLNCYIEVKFNGWEQLIGDFSVEHYLEKHKLYCKGTS